MASGPPTPPGPGATQAQIYAYDTALYQYNNGIAPAPSPAPPPTGTFLTGTNTTSYGTNTLNSAQLASLPTAQALAAALGGTVVTATQPGNSVPTYGVQVGGNYYNAGLLQSAIQRYGSIAAAIQALNIANPNYNAPLANSPAAIPVPPPSSVASTGSQGSSTNNPTAPPPGSSGGQNLSTGQGDPTAPVGSEPTTTTPGTVPIIQGSGAPSVVGPVGNASPGGAPSSGMAATLNLPLVGPVSLEMAILGGLVLVVLIIVYAKMK